MKKKVEVVVLIAVMLLGTSTLAEINTSFSEKNGGLALPTKSSLLQNEEYDMVIISPKMFSSELQSLIDHKNSHDVRTFLKTTDDIYTEYQGRDEAEQIKYFIKEVIEKYGVHYVFLAGDVHKVPMRKCAISVVTGILNWYEILSDLYYADIYDSNGGFSSWDANNNEKYCEYYFDLSSGEFEIIDNVDLYPDVGVGRLPCNTIEECTTIVDKIIHYETSTYGNDWFDNILLMGGDTFPNFESALEGEWLHEQYIGPEMEKHGFNLVKLYTSLDTFQPKRITDEINTGAGFISYAGHGHMDLISTFTPLGTTTISYTVRDIKELINGYKLPVIFLDACLTGKIDYDIFDKIMIPLNSLFPNDFMHNLKRFLDTIETKRHFPCFAEVLLNKQSGGAIAVIAATQPIILDLDYNVNGEIIDISFGPSILNRFFFESYVPGIRLSDMFVEAQNLFINRIVDPSITLDLITLNEINLFGDPSLKIGGYP